MGCCASAPGSPGGESAVARARREARGVAIPHFNRSGVTDACVLSDPSGSAARLFAGLDARRGANAYVSDPYRGEPIARWHAHDKPVSRVAWLPRARKLLTASRDGTCALWSDPQQIPDDEPLLHPGGGGFAPALATYRAGDLPVTGLCAVEERGVFVTASRDYSVKVWDLEAATSVVSSPSSASRVSRNVATHLRRVPGEPLVVQTSEDLRVRVFDLRVPLHEAAAVQTLESGHGDIPKCVDVAEDGVTVLVGANGFERGAGCELRIFDRRALSRSSADPGSGGSAVRMTTFVREMRGHEAAVNGVAFVPGVRGAGGGAIAVSASTDRTVRVWDCGRGDEIGPAPLRFDGYEKSPGDAGAVTCVAAAPPEVGGEGEPGAFVAGEYGGKTQAWRIVDGGTGETVSEAWTEGEAPEE